MNIRPLTYNNETLSIQGWANKLGVSRDTLATRLRRGWPIDKVISQTIRNVSLSSKIIDNGVEAWHELMLCRGYFRKENRIKIYKMLNTWYKEFQSQDMRAA